MKFSSFSIAALVAQGVSAHYWFDTNIVNGAVQPGYKYVRESSRKTKYNPIKFSSNPAADLRDGSTIDGPDSRCNQGAFSSAGRTDVLTVNAGDEIRLRLAASSQFQHPGESRLLHYEPHVVPRYAVYDNQLYSTNCV